MRCNDKFLQAEFGKYPVDWKVVKIGDVLSLLTDYHANGSYKKLKENVELLDEENYAIMIRTTNFEQQNFDKTGFKYITKEAYDFLQKTKVHYGDILMNKIANAGSVYLMPKLSKPVSLAMNLFLLRFNEEVIDQTYAFYFLKNYESYIKTRATGSVTKTITKDNVRNLEITVPELNEQIAITQILSSLDEKIETNNRINKTLEEMAAAIFKHWFVDFEFPNEDGEPYRSSGGEMIESELGIIPKGWMIKKLDDLTSKFATGLNPRKNFKLGLGNNYYVTIKNMYNQRVVLNDKCDRVDDEALGKINKRSDLRKGDLLFSGIGTIGRVYMLDETPTNWNISESIFTLRPNEEVTTEFLYLLLLSDELQGYAKQLASGSVQKGIRMADLKAYKIPIPDNPLISDFTNVVKEILVLIKNNEKENMKLNKIMSILIPKLISGEIRVPVGEYGAVSNEVWIS